MNFNQRNLVAVMAGLRLLQYGIARNEVPKRVSDILTRRGTLPPPRTGEIDQLCDDLSRESGAALQVVGADQCHDSQASGSDDRRFFLTTVTIEVLSQDSSVEDLPVARILDEIDTGECLGHVSKSARPIPSDDVLPLSLEFGNDGTFFDALA